jgi:1,4-alpha-glucan branching enzyme
MDERMYFSMAKNIEDLVVERGIALHKMIRLATLATAGNGYLNFMGNEFGHPEWIDFPREGNDWSYFYARRQWNLVDDKKLRYSSLNEFDKAMIHLIKSENILSFYSYNLVQNIPDQVLIFKRGKLVFAFNFNPLNSFTNYGFEVDKGIYQVVLNTDAKEFDGQGRNDDSVKHFTVEENNKTMLKIYLPNRSALVFKKN